MYNKFIEVGCRNVEMALTPGQAKKQMEKICDVCCTHGVNLECRTCPIWATYKLIMRSRWGKKVKEDEGC